MFFLRVLKMATYRLTLSFQCQFWRANNCLQCFPWLRDTCNVTCLVYESGRSCRSGTWTHQSRLGGKTRFPHFTCLLKLPFNFKMVNIFLVQKPCYAWWYTKSLLILVGVMHLVVFHTGRLLKSEKNHRESPPAVNLLIYFHKNSQNKVCISHLPDCRAGI